MTVAASAAVTGALSRKSAFTVIRIRRSSETGMPSGRPRSASRGLKASSSSSVMCSASRPNARNELATMLVPTCPGITTATRTCGAFVRRSSMSASEKPFTANFAVL